MLRLVAFVRTDISEERIASIIRETIIGELGTALALTISRLTLRRNIRRSISITVSVVPSLPILVTLMMEVIRSTNVGSYKSHVA
jgi:hypothetical protein